MKAFEVMTTPVVTVRPETRLGDAAQLLARHGINTLPVTDNDGRLVGVVTETDVFRALALRLGIGLSPTARLDSAHAPHRVSDIAHEAAAYVRRDDTVAMCLALMARHDGNSLPVLDAGRVAGIITRREALVALAQVDRARLDDRIAQGRLPTVDDVLVLR